MVKCSMDFPNLNSNPLKGEKELNTFHDKRIVSKIFLKSKKKKKIHNVLDEPSKRDDFNFKGEVKNGPINNRSSPQVEITSRAPSYTQKKEKKKNRYIYSQTTCPTFI